MFELSEYTDGPEYVDIDYQNRDEYNHSDILSVGKRIRITLYEHEKHYPIPFEHLTIGEFMRGWGVVWFMFADIIILTANDGRTRYLKHRDPIPEDSGSSPQTP